MLCPAPTQTDTLSCCPLLLPDICISAAPHSAIIVLNHALKAVTTWAAPLQVTGVGEYERISGSSLGGGTFWGLCQLLTGLKNFDEMLELSMGGDNTTVGGCGPTCECHAHPVH